MSAEGGFGEKDPLLEHTDDCNDNDVGDTTGPFDPNRASTPPPGQMTTNLPTERGSTTAETSFTEGLPDIPGSFSTTTFTAEGQLDKEFPFAKKENLKYRINTKNDRLQVGLIKPNKNTGEQKPYYDLITKNSKTDKYQINPRLPKEVLKELGTSRRNIIGEKIKKLTQDINDNKKVADDENQSVIERNKARERAKRQIDERTDLQKELNQLQTLDYDTTRFETIPLQEFQQNQEERREKQKEIQQEKEKQEEIANDENEVPAVRQRARERIEELEIENNQIENENEREL